MVKNKYDTDYSETTKLVYGLIHEVYGYSARISIFWDLLKLAFSIKNFELLDFNAMQNGSFMAYLIDRQVDWQDGKDVNFSDIYDAILAVGEFTGSEKLMFESGEIEDRLWAIYLSVTSPDLNIQN